MSGELWAVRHAPVDAKGICYGQSDVPVVVPPDVAATAVLHALSTRPSVVISSPWARARDLGAALAAACGATSSVDARLSALDFGRWEGRLFTEIERTEPASMERWMSHWGTEATPGGETIASLEARVSTLLATLSDEPDTLIVAHAGVLRALRVLTRGIEWEHAMREPVPHLVPERVKGRPDPITPPGQEPTS